MKKLTKIPSEFSLAKYDAVAQFDSKEWFVNLEKRYELFALCNTPFHLIDADNADGLAAVANMQASTRKKVLALLENPIVPIEESNSSLFGLQDDAVVTLKNKDFFTLLQCTNFEYKENYQTFVKELTENSTSGIVTRPRNSKLSDKYFWGVDISPLHSAFAQVDLWNSDEKLVEDFKAWVKTEKAKRYIDVVDNKGSSKIPDKIRKHPPTQADFNQWAENNVLPYLDLTLWAKANQGKITLETLGEALFAANELVDDTTLKVTRSTKPKADELMDQSTLMIFANAVKKEIKPESQPIYPEDFLQRIKDGLAKVSKNRN
jgi:hypothetical protein